MPEILKVAEVKFPEPTGVYANMMPFIIGDLQSIPMEYKQYLWLINSCGIEDEQIGKIGYLTIQENAVNSASPTHRRPGIHTEGHGKGGGWGTWGAGEFNGLRSRGLYMASTISNSCRVWDFNVEDYSIGRMGDCEYLRPLLEKRPAVYMQKNVLYWMTDRCPHESLPLPPGTFRQYFRLVTSAVDMWYERHSTANSLGVKAPCKIIHEDKFASV